MDKQLGPLSMEEITRQYAETGWVTGVAKVYLNDVIRGDLESFLELLSTKLTDSDLLMQHEYKVLGVDPDSENLLVIEVTGDPSMVVACDGYDEE